ncbi:hypothetical protein RDI58_019688 [Solanum bulbocastanum]|uniref:Uncharacterized protein n=1 Tax=Solanum bulbocastanum TaxID=147425 RepID=A0AAN8TB31_SOLBU
MRPLLHTDSLKWSKTLVDLGFSKRCINCNPFNHVLCLVIWRGSKRLTNPFLIKLLVDPFVIPDDLFVVCYF